MNRFSKKSERNLSSCHPDLQILFREVVDTFDCCILEGNITSNPVFNETNI